ncbi:GxxExxY protein [Hymenobacter arizonensis]|uniref:GxxExxY protein n=1 Tax=Hymenobacter arizonensis TaxID=1227077 RepID=A0A1I5XPK4_HYMAR|nr:GxxExxY protein [Hymenobacter arizonensis]SFQ33766.1 GxxExxY protein [Hymenobacter arizonensis]
MERDELTGRILGVAFRVHTVLGPGLLESVYEVALAHELRKAGLLVATQVEMPVVYDGIRLDLAFRADMIVEGLVILELKSVEALVPVHSKQLLNYLRLSGLKTGLLINFNTVSLKDQLIRLSN